MSGSFLDASDDLTCLNIGAGISKIPGFVNIDISERADLVIDLNSDTLPFDESSVDLIFSYHTLEHVENYVFAVSELFRVLKPGGWLLLGVPYVTLGTYNLINPYHRQNFNEHSFDFFNPNILKGSAAEENPIHFEKVFHSFHYIGGFHFVPPPLRGWCRRHLFNVVRKIDFGLVAVKDGRAPTIDAELRRKMKSEFRACLDARVPYPDLVTVDGKTYDAPSGLRQVARKVARWWKGH